MFTGAESGRKVDRRVPLQRLLKRGRDTTPTTPRPAGPYSPPIPCVALEPGQWPEETKSERGRRFAPSTDSSRSVVKGQGPTRPRD